MTHVLCTSPAHETVRRLEQVKAVVETSLQLMLSAKESGGNIKNLQWHKIVDNHTDALISCTEQLVGSLKESSPSKVTVHSLAENIRQMVPSLDMTKPSHQGHFVEYQTRMLEILRVMTRLIQEILTQINHSDAIRSLADRLTRDYSELITVTHGAMGTASSVDLAGRIKHVITELGLVLAEFIEKLADENPQTSSTFDLEKLSQKVIEKVGSRTASTIV